MYLEAWISISLALVRMMIHIGSAQATVDSSAYDLVSPLPLDADLNYEFSGSTVLNRKFVKLTADSPGKHGMIVSKQDGPLPENFVFTMDFKLEGESRTLYGDGMAVWFLEEAPSQGSMMGLNEYYKGVSIIIDTYRNGKAGRIFPRMILAQNDGTKPYDRDHDGRANEIESCGLRGIHNNKRQEYSSLRVSYSRSTRKLFVEVNFRHKWETCVSADLDIGPVTKIAVSAATGELSETHVIKDLRLQDLGTSLPPVILKSHKKGIKDKIKDDKEPGAAVSFIGSFFRKLFKLIMLGGAIWIAFRGWKEYKKYQKKREDDLYKLN